MAKSSNTWIWWTIGGITLLGLGVGAFIFIKDRKDKKKILDASAPETSSSTSPEFKPSTQTSSSLSSTPFKSKTEGDAFRQWVNQKDSAYARSISLDLSGKFDNPTIRKAWAKYGQEYLNRSTTSGATSNQNILPSDTASILNSLKSKLSGGKVKDVELDSKNKRVRGFALDGTGYGSNNIYVNIYENGYIYFEDGSDSNKKQGSWNGISPMTITVEGQTKTGEPNFIVHELAKILYPNVKGYDFAADDFTNFLFEGSVENDNKIDRLL